jgi:hypothetical protein
MVVIATPNYSDTSVPGVVRIRRASGSSFQVRMSAASTSGELSNVAVHYLVVEEGVYDSPRMEARKIESDGTNGKGAWAKKSMEEYVYAQAYNKPVVLGQVMTYRDPGFSVFWASRGSRKKPPSATACYVGKHVAEDTDTSREPETLGVIVIERGSGVLDGISYTAGLSPKSVKGLGNAPAYAYSVGGVSNAGTAILSSAAIKGKNGAWPVLYGNGPVSASTINIAVDEDSIRDQERRHGAEKLAYIVFGEE